MHRSDSIGRGDTDGKDHYDWVPQWSLSEPDLCGRIKETHPPEISGGAKLLQEMIILT